MPAVLDHVFEFIGRNLTPARSKTRFFHEGWGDLALARDVARRSLEYFDPTRPTTELKNSLAVIQWSASTAADAGYGVGIVRQDATFESPFAEFLPPESRKVRFARLRPSRTDDASGTPVKKTRVAVLLPCTGDVDEWYRRSIARELLESGVECVIPTIAYYGERKPAEQWRHVLRSVAEAKIQFSVTPIEMMALIKALRSEASNEGRELEMCIAGVSLGGTMSALTANALARQGEPAAASTAVCCVAAANDCTPYTDGSIETRLAWDVLCEQLPEEGEDGDVDSSCWGVNSTGGASLKERARGALLETMTELNMSALVAEKSVRAAVFVTAKDDRFVGHTTEKFAQTLQTMAADEAGYSREDFDGGHLQFIFGRKHVIAPSIKRAFDLIER